MKRRYIEDETIDFGEREEVNPPRPNRTTITLDAVLVDKGVIGEGGTAWVNQVYDERLKRRLAMKVPKSDVTELARDQFEQEVLVTAQLDHPAVVPVHCAGVDDQGRPNCFTMKLVEGETLAKHLVHIARPWRGETLAEFLRILLKVCDAVAFAHSRGVIHRDLKPENIMIGRFGEVYVMDWGIALVGKQSARSHPLETKRSLTPQGRIIGTVWYMAPEQATGQVDRIDERTDIFALGGILYEVLTGISPRTGDDVDALLNEAKTKPVVSPDVICSENPPPAALSDIAMKALAFDKDSRYGSAEEFKLAIEEFLYAGSWFHRRRFKNGTIILREDESGDCAYIVEQGECEIYRIRDGQTQILRRVGRGEVFGELALFATEKRTANVRASTEVVLLELSRETVERDLPIGSWARQVVETLGRRFYEYDQILQRLRKRID